MSQNEINVMETWQVLEDRWYKWEGGDDGDWVPLNPSISISAAVQGGSMAPQ